VLVQFQEVPEVSVCPHISPVGQIFYIVVQLYPPLIQVHRGGNLEESLSRQSRNLRMLLPQIHIQLLELVVAPHDCPLFASKSYLALVKNNFLSFYHFFYKSRNRNLEVILRPYCELLDLSLESERLFFFAFFHH